MITLYELKGTGGRLYSLFSWRTRTSACSSIRSRCRCRTRRRSGSPALKRQPFACGASPAYADYIVFSVFQWARVMSPYKVLAGEDPLAAWRERILDLDSGFARNVPVA